MARRRDQRFEITPGILLKAYACGIFPMAENADDPGLFWIDPEERGIIPLDSFHVSRSLRKTIRRGTFEMRYDSAFPAVIDACAEPAPGRANTWINAEIRKLYLQLFQNGNAHSVEAWRDGHLVGGLYGVSLGGAFFGESMFSRETDASKVSLAFLVERLRLGGYRLLDAQFITSHLAQFGAVEISRADYHERLEEAVALPATFYPAGGGTAESLLQPVSQTS
ncbi:leucyl/phenylalanyl-tRNA--protein transferase [Aureimonas sp. SA4125]|uniref:leucyl/phenylalanyl-tRNA--protein transferase n=1 Tax=Aureimonas sp. SA4125 TaxID=2826993 RepID=UPI001CC73939|nr:leucyl/phenylalanyl-tRNA--protein transferase [Aureimonas sp. SA4125]BDA84498.1 leucyl/phenylalanyl-tRNA--protein transferase [Aureimonas sp. SA4125]